MVVKVAVATIDRRTTLLCVSVHGQIRPPGEPFDTLGGAQSDPPFHWNCRTIVDLWEEGMYDIEALESEAQQEFDRRLAEMGDEKLAKAIAQSRKLRPPNASVRAVMTESVDEFVEGLKMGTRTLDDVPDRLLKEVIDRTPTLTKTANGGGISETFWVTDNRSGARYVLKRGQYHNESINEVMVSRLMREIGFDDIPLVRFAEEVSGNAWVLIEHVENMRSYAGLRFIGTAPGHERIAAMVYPSDGRQRADMMKTMLMDFLFDGADRKGGNILRLAVEKGDPERWVPIDNSLSLMGWRGADEAAGDWSLAARREIDSFSEYIASTRGAPRGLYQQIREWPEEEVDRLVEDFVSRVASPQFNDALENLALSIGHDADEAWDLIARRRDVMVDEPQRFASEVMGGRRSNFTEEKLRSVLDDDPGL